MDGLKELQVVVGRSELKAPARSRGAKRAARGSSVGLQAADGHARHRVALSRVGANTIGSDVTVDEHGEVVGEVEVDRQLRRLKRW